MSAFPSVPLALALTLALTQGSGSAGCPEPSAETAPLGDYCAAIAARPRLPLPTPADRQALHAVFERPELRRARTDTAGIRRLIVGLWARIMELLGSADAERYASVGRMVFILAALASALAGLSALGRRRSSSSLAHGTEAAERAPLPPPDRSAALAEAALAQGDLTGAVRHAFLSALAALEEARRLPRDRTLTNRELAGKLAGTGGPVAGEFAALGRLFDGVVYGGARVREPEARSSLATAARIRERAGWAT